MEKISEMQSQTRQVLVSPQHIDNDSLERDTEAKPEPAVLLRRRAAESRAWAGYLRGSR
jgi:hypothetical protein